MKIITTKEKADKAFKFATIVTLKYCISNKLDFSIESEDDIDTVANSLYDEIFSNKEYEYTKMFNRAIL